MKAVYDFNCSPPQFDVLTFLAHAEIERIRRGESAIELILAAGPREGHRDNDAWPNSTAARDALVENVVIPAAKMVPSITDITRAGSDAASRAALRGLFGFEARLYGLPAYIDALASPHGRCLRAGPVTPQPDLVTITLREAEHWLERNSDYESWLAVADQLEIEGWHVVFVRDTLCADEEISGFETAPDAAKDLRCRARLYAAARVNLHVNSGPCALAMLMNAPVLMFRPTCPTHMSTSPDFMAAHGMVPGRDYPGSPSWQRVVWADDTPAAILPAVRQFMGDNPPGTSRLSCAA